MIVEKSVFRTRDVRTVGGDTIAEVAIGWESYGRPNADRSNAILVTHFFSATGHAAGRYAADEALPGWWDAVIGPGRAIDTDRWWVLASDTLVNLNVGAAHVVTTGPCSIDPATGRPYGPDFPVVQIRDFVTVQAALLDHLGIARLHAVVGPSMGALQAYEWAVAHPDRVGRIVPVIGAAGGHPSLVAWLDAWGMPIRLDPAWRGGRYHESGAAPVAGLAASLGLVALHAQGDGWAEGIGRGPAPGGDPGRRAGDRFRIEAQLASDARSRAATADANHLLYLARANQLTAVDPARIRVPTLLIDSPTDRVFPIEWMDRTAAGIAAAGTPVERASVRGPNGHLNGIAHIQQASGAMSAFLSRAF